MNINDEFSIFTIFYQLLDNTGVVPINEPSVFLSGASPSSDPGPTITNVVPESPKIIDGKQNIYDIEQKLTLVRDGHGEEVILESVDVDFDTIVPYYTVKVVRKIDVKKYL